MALRYHINIRSSSTRRVDSFLSPQPVDTSYGCNPEYGDVVIGEVSELGQHTRFEEPAGREIVLQVGDVIAVVLGRRYSTKEFYGGVPDRLAQRAEFDLLNVGGIAGEAWTRNTLAKAPTKLVYLGHAVDNQGQKINTFNFGINTSEEQERAPLKIIAVFGSDMDCGKTMTAGRITNILSTNGFKVGGGKLTGTSRMKDILSMKACGANFVLDFMDVGYPSTCQCSLPELEHIFRIFKTYFSLNGCEFLVMEIADGIFQRETEMVLNCPTIMRDISLFAFSAADSVSAYGGIEYIQKHYNLKPDFISGLIIADSLSMTELRSRLEVQFLENNTESRNNFLRMLQQKI